MKNYSPHLSLAHEYWEKLLHPEDIAIDATMGNGQDTLKLAQLLHHSDSRIIAIDIQQKAIDQTKERLCSALSEEQFHRIAFYCQNHAEIDQIQIPKPPRLIVYNLGYLPGADKTLTTLTATTMQSIEKAVQIVSPDGALSITCYPGHEEGSREQHAILEWATHLSPSEWQICHHTWINRPRSPNLLWIHRVVHNEKTAANENRSGELKRFL